MTPMGLAVTKLPEATFKSLPAIGEFAIPIDSKASISTLTKPAASLTHCRAISSVMRKCL